MDPDPEVPDSLVGEYPVQIEYRGIQRLGFQGQRPSDVALSFNLAKKAIG